MAVNDAGLAYWRTHWNFLAICDECDWNVDAKNGLGLAAKHCRATGHLVRVEQTRTLIYGEERPGAKEGRAPVRRPASH